MSFIIISIDIKEYLPISFNYEDFKFIFSHNKHVFGDEISFISKNKIIQKIKLEQKDINFSVKVIKRDSLIGVCNFIIPYKNILSKQIQNYETECLINMTDSTKRILSIGNINLKLKICCEIRNIEKYKEIIQSNKQKFLIVNKKAYKSKININSVKIHHFIYTKKNSNQVKNLNHLDTEEDNINLNMNNNNLVYNKPRNYSKKKLKKIIGDENDSLNSLDEEKILSKSKETNEFTNNEFSDFVHNLIKENPLEDLMKMNNIDEMILITKNNIVKFLNYQQEMNNLIKEQIDKNNEFRKLLKKYSQKYANKIKKWKILEKKQKINGINKKLINSKVISSVNKIIEIKNNEINLFKEISNNCDEYDYNIEYNLNINEINNLNDNNKNNYNILYNLLRNCISKFGKNENIMKIIPKNLRDINNNLNNNETEVNCLDTSLADNDDNFINIKNCEENENSKLKYIESNSNDEIDYELDEYLKAFYENNKNIPIIMFKKIHDNNYKYGKKQIIAIEEGDTIKIKDDNGIFPLNKFLELNAYIPQE